MNEIRNELNLLSKSVKIRRPEAAFQFELTGVSKFFEIAGNNQESDTFSCGDLQWYLSAECKRESRSKSLAFYLWCEDDDRSEWFCEVSFKLILFSKLSSKPNLVRKTSCAFNGEHGSGFSPFVSYHELTDKKNGYILDDDKILLGVEMKAGPVIED